MCDMPLTYERDPAAAFLAAAKAHADLVVAFVRGVQAGDDTSQDELLAEHSAATAAAVWCTARAVEEATGEGEDPWAVANALFLAVLFPTPFGGGDG